MESFALFVFFFFSLNWTMHRIGVTSVVLDLFYIHRIIVLFSEVTIPVAVVMVEDVQMIDGQIVEILRTSTAMPVTMDLEFTTNYTQSDTDIRTITSKDAVSTEITNAALASATEMSKLLILMRCCRCRYSKTFK